MATPEQSARLNRLIVRCRDDSKTYRAAAGVQSSHRDELLALSRRRSAFANALSTLVRSSGTTPSEGGSVAGWLRRKAFDFRVGALGITHLGDSLLACANEESRAASGYRDALKNDWSPEIEGVLRAQLGEIRESYERMRTLRGSV